MAGFHHGISAQEVTQGILPMRNANTSVLGLVVTSTDADDTMYPVSTPVLLTGITQDNIDNAGTNGTLRDCLQAIRDIHNPTIVILRMSEPLDVDTLDVLLTCPSRFGLMPKRLGAPEIDTPEVVLKLVSIAKDRRAIVYASPRTAEGVLITDKALITAYRDTYGDRELCLIDGEWGVPGKSDSSPSAGDGGGANTSNVNFLKIIDEVVESDGVVGIGGIVYSLNGAPPTFDTISIESSDAIFTSVLAAEYNTPAQSFDVFVIDSDNQLVFNSGQLRNPVYFVGFSDMILNDLLASIGLPLADLLEGQVEITLYPSSKMPAANFDHDVFDLIVDPANYTAQELQYFAAMGVTPAVKNPDGSYTIKSQLTIPPIVPSGV